MHLRERGEPCQCRSWTGRSRIKSVAKRMVPIGAAPSDLQALLLRFLICGSLLKKLGDVLIPTNVDYGVDGLEARHPTSPSVLEKRAHSV